MADDTIGNFGYNYTPTDVLLQAGLNAATWQNFKDQIVNVPQQLIDDVKLAYDNYGPNAEQIRILGQAIEALELR